MYEYPPTYPTRPTGRQTTVVTVEEYDNKGNLIKKTVTTTTTEPESFPTIWNGTATSSTGYALSTPFSARPVKKKKKTK